MLRVSLRLWGQSPFGFHRAQAGVGDWYHCEQTALPGVCPEPAGKWGQQEKDRIRELL